MRLAPSSSWAPRLGLAALVSCGLLSGCYEHHVAESSVDAAVVPDQARDGSLPGQDAAPTDAAPFDAAPVDDAASPPDGDVTDASPPDLGVLPDTGPSCIPLPEVCGSLVDEDCDGLVDEVVETVTCGVGQCASQGESCDDALPAQCVPLPPQEEVCNGLDDDCDGTIDVIDRGADGVPDCLTIVLLGQSGSQDSGTFEQWIRTNGASSSRVLTGAGETLTADLIADADVVILDQLPRSYAASEAAVLEAWVRAGGGLMAVTGHYNQSPTVDRANSLLVNLGLAFVFQLPVINTNVTRFADHAAVERVRTVPVIGGFPVITTSPTALIVGTDVSGRSLIGVNEVDLGRVYLFSDEWVMFDSQWSSLAEDLRRFWSSALRWLGQTRVP